VTSVNIYEVFNPGVIDTIMVAQEYNGRDTVWTTIWSSPIPGGAEDVDSQARIFTPPVCPVNRTKQSNNQSLISVLDYSNLQCFQSRASI